jgi:trans-2,3-dihydro-3-hydroxyanthranilate isomerase
MTTYAYYTADVFTTERFGGNQLAVLPDAQGLSDEQMLAIAREFNYSETTFVLPPADPAHTRRVRIFTPGGEIPFAGHPTVGTAWVLARTGEIRLHDEATHVVLEEGVGPVPVTIRVERGAPVHCQFSVAKLPEVLAPLPPPEDLAATLSLDVGDLLNGAMPPQVVSCGLPFAFVALRDRAAVRKARIRPDVWERTLAGRPGEMVMVFALDPEGAGHDVRARMFAPGVGVPEDPATGSACAALGGYLAARDPAPSGTTRWIVEQGYEMGRPSAIHVEVDADDSGPSEVRVGGRAVEVAEGSLRF